MPATAATAQAADVTISDAAITGGKLVISGTASPNSWVRLDGQAGSAYNVKSGADGSFSLSVYHPGDCVVGLQKVVSPTTIGEATEALVANCGPAGLTPRGAWSGKAAYATNDLVTYEGSSYRAKRNNAGRQPGAAADWEVFAAKGDSADGADGGAGRDGGEGTLAPPDGPAGGDLAGLYPNPTIANGAVTTNRIADQAITTPKLGIKVVKGANMADDAINTRSIIDNAVVSASVADDTLAGGGLAAVDLQANSVGQSEIATDGVGASEISDGAVDSAAVLDGAVTSAKILDGAVTGAKILDGSVSGADVLNESLTSADLATDSVNATEIANNSIDSGEIASESILASDLAVASVGSSEIVDGAVGNAEIAANAVTSAKVAGNSLTTADIKGADVNGGGISVPTGYVPNGRCRQLDASVGGATAGEAVVFSIKAPLQDGILIYGQRVPSNGHVTFSVCNFSGTTQAAIVDIPVRVITFG